MPCSQGVSGEAPVSQALMLSTFEVLCPLTDSQTMVREEKARVQFRMRAFCRRFDACGLFSRSFRGLGLGVEPNAILLLVVVEDGTRKDVESFRAPLFKNLIAHLVIVLGDLIDSWLLLVHQLCHYAGALRIDGSADCARGHVEELWRYLAHLTEIRHLACLANQVAGLYRGAHFLGCLGKVVRALRLGRQFRRLLAEQYGQSLIAIVFGDLGFPVGKGRGVGRGHSSNLEDRVSFSGGGKLRRVALL